MRHENHRAIGCGLGAPVRVDREDSSHAEFDISFGQKLSSRAIFRRVGFMPTIAMSPLS
jgi:hypothetical protein